MADPITISDEGDLGEDEVMEADKAGDQEFEANGDGALDLPGLGVIDTPARVSFFE